MEQTKPNKQVIVKHKEHQTVQEFAAMLEQMAKKLKEEGTFHFVQGTEKVEVTPADQLKVEYEYTVKGDEHEFEIEFEWYEGGSEEKTMKIE